ncbi:hypothetical protein [Nocardia sp. NBC_00403]|uniref:hypothetical protein n=1 Tax=Nocardia sp. NBC_00403 TaxID=2975990 RepID=UPI002E21D50F
MDIVLVCAFHRPLRIATAALAVTGVCLAITGLALSLAHEDRGRAGVFAVVAVVLMVAAAMVLRGGRWVSSAAVILLGGQWIAMAATIFELVHGIDWVKTQQLQRLGVDPTVGVTINLVFSSIAALLFAWFALRYAAIRRNRS